MQRKMRGSLGIGHTTVPGFMEYSSNKTSKEFFFVFQLGKLYSFDFHFLFNGQVLLLTVGCRILSGLNNGLHFYMRILTEVITTFWAFNLICQIFSLTEGVNSNSYL